MRAICLNCTMKRSPEKSSTASLSDVADDRGARVVDHDRPDRGAQPPRSRARFAGTPNHVAAELI
jgi:hypothetical protein